uniref:ParE toxin of type II toxin-antitoxin system, parDE n=1 Tax=Candidatus Kentrum sp. SD TaxID=2126332 RepID=A0A451BI67_9GAMM|nr:MAG: ParE toxin of type II toxin-antitoxin system, parDE [Candidatus Kentron sp. SD]
MKIARFLLPAEVEMCEAAIYYQTQVDGLGDAFLTKVDSAVRDIVEHPLAWPVVQGDVRKRPIHRFPYSILYQDNPNEILIIAVMHQRRRPGYWLGRIAG